MSESNLTNLQPNYRTETHAHSEFDSEMKQKLEDLLQPSKMKDEHASIQFISSYIVENIHLSEAAKVIEHITKRHFRKSEDPHSMESAQINQEALSKKYLFFYLAFDLIFKTKQMKGTTVEDSPNIIRQMLQKKAADGTLEHEVVEADKLAYVYAIGDNLQQWVTYLCLDVCETDYARLKEILNVLNLWEQQFIYQKKFIDRLKLFIGPQHDIAKSKYMANQCLQQYANAPGVSYTSYENDQ
jgi:hypothetical protein